MKHFRVEQRDIEWYKLRAGKPTSSEFHRIVTPKGKISSQARGYQNHLIAELLLGRPIVDRGSEWMERGQELEERAAAAYEFETDAKLELAGFVTNDEETIGCSPDRFVKGGGLVEIKCPSPQVHVGYLLDKAIDEKYTPQLQGQLWLTGEPWVDIVSYHPGLPTAIVRVLPDAEYIALLAEAVPQFAKELRERYEGFAK